MDAITRVVSEKQDVFNVRLVGRGDKYGLNDCLTHDEDTPLVEFYVVSERTPEGGRGYFISRYCLETLLANIARTPGLCLHGGPPSVEIDGDSLRRALTALSVWGPAKKETEHHDHATT
jgi:hypothetical protein